VKVRSRSDQGVVAMILVEPSSQKVHERMLNGTPLWCLPQTKGLLFGSRSKETHSDSKPNRKKADSLAMQRPLDPGKI
jgi:hypothetical protein